MPKLLIASDPTGSASHQSIQSGWAPEDITVWELDARHAHAVSRISDKIDIILDDNSHSVLNSIDMKYDLVMGNPPYLKNLHLKFLLKSLQISDSVNLIHPAGWLFRETKSIERQVKDALKGRVKKLVLFNGNTTFDGTEFACPLVRTYAVKSHTGPIEVQSEITGNTYYINDLSEFPTGYWEPNDLHLEIISVIKNIAMKGDINSLVKVKSNKPFLGCPRVVGHGKVMNPRKYAHEDFHIFHYRNSDLYNANAGDKVFELSNNEEVQSLKSYLETKFARFALSICKISQDSYVSRYFENVPLPPLDRHWTEQSVNEYYELTEEQVEYIQYFIPNYY